MNSKNTHRRSSNQIDQKADNSQQNITYFMNDNQVNMNQLRRCLMYRKRDQSIPSRNLPILLINIGTYIGLFSNTLQPMLKNKKMYVRNTVIFVATHM